MTIINAELIPKHLLNKVSLYNDYECMLINSNVESNENKCIYMLILKHNTIESYFHIMKYGRIGVSMNFKINAYIDSNKCIIEFESIFYDKTGLQWKNKKDTPILNKYSYLSINSINIINCNSNDNDNKVITKEVHDLLKELKCELNDYMKNNNVLAQLPEKIIIEGTEILDTIYSTINNGSLNKELLTILSNKYYKLIPNNGKISIIDNNYKIDHQRGLIDFYNYLNGKIISNEEIINSKYVITHINDDTEEFNIINNYCMLKQINTKSKIRKLFKVKFIQENKCIYGNDNEILLFHGTKKQNIIPILNNGFKLPLHGGMFGKGCYFANVSIKSQGYSDKYLFLANISLGKHRILQTAMNSLTSASFNLTMKPNKQGEYNSIYAIGATSISQTYLKYNGLNIPQKLVQNQKVALNFDEYIVYDPSAINIKYIVHI